MVVSIVKWALYLQSPILKLLKSCCARHAGMTQIDWNDNISGSALRKTPTKTNLTQQKIFAWGSSCLLTILAPCSLTWLVDWKKGFSHLNYDADRSNPANSQICQIFEHGIVCLPPSSPCFWFFCQAGCRGEGPFWLVASPGGGMSKPKVFQLNRGKRGLLGTHGALIILEAII